ncbi:MAG: hypothetical protein JNK35_09190 [Phycisphaerae bacterium]|nr:hypothetical protein [Phycisphaerae bacterium]
MKARRSTLSVVAAAGTMLAAGTALGQQTFFTWTGPAGGAWSAAGNWNPIGVPDVAGDVALIPGGTSPILTIGINIDKFGMGLGSTLTVNNGASLGVRGQNDNLGITGIFGGEGTIVLNSAGAGTDLVISGGAGFYAVHGNTSGLPARIATSNTQANRIYGASGVEKLVFDVETLFEGSAQIGLNQLEIENYGALRAVGSSGVTIDPNGQGLTNHGVIEAVSGSMVLTGGTFRNMGAGALVSNSAPLIITGARVEGGLLDTATLGQILLQGGSTAANCRLNGSLVIPNGHQGRIETALVFQSPGSTLLINSAGANADLVIANNALLDGSTLVSGVTASNTQANRMYSDGGDKRLTLHRGFIRGSMQLGVNLMALTVTPTGVVEAVGSQGITLDPNGDGVLNEGLLAARTGSSLLLTGGTFDNQGVIQSDTGGGVVVSGATVIGGSLAGGGPILAQGASTLQSVTSGAAVSVPNGHTAFLGLTYTNNATLTINSAGATTDLRLIGATTLNGSGVLQSSNTQANRLFGGTLVNAAGHTIRGSMQLGVNLTTIVNNGAIESSGNQGITIDPDAGGLDNNGTIRSLSGSPLTLTGGTFDNADGMIIVDHGGLGVLSAATVTGGALVTTGSGSVNLQGSSVLENVSSAAQIFVPNGQTGFLGQTFVNTEVLTINSLGATTDLQIVGSTTVSGPGAIEATNTQANRFYGDPGAVLTNAAGHTIRGSMALGVNLVSLVNNGTVEAIGSQGITIDPDAGGVDNNALLRALPGSTLTLTSGMFDNQGGAIDARDNSTVHIVGATVLGGQFTAAGSGGFVHRASSVLEGVTSGAPIFIPNGDTGFLRTQMINNATITINSAGATTDLRAANDLVLTGTGVITSTNTQANRLFAASDGLMITNALGHTIRGAMALGAGQTRLVNHGLIEAQGSQGITANPGPHGMRNDGIVRALAGSIVTFSGGGTFDNTGGTIDGPSGATLVLTGSRLTGGVVTTSGSGNLVLTGSAVIDDLDLFATSSVPNGTAAFMRNAISNHGTLTINSLGATTDLRIDASTVLDGTGFIEGTNTQANRLFASSDTLTLTNGPFHTIRGSMSLGAGQTTLVNQGTIHASVSQGIHIAAGPGGFSNAGSLLVTGGNVVISGPMTTSGTVIVGAGRRLDRPAGAFIQTGGMVLADGEIQVNSEDYRLQGGTLGGSGLVDSSVVNSGGTLSPGASAGTLTIEGNYTQQSGGRFHFEVGSTMDPALNDTLNVISGSATLGGTIRIDRLNGFVPPLGQGFTIVATAPNQRFGTFAAIESDDFWHIEYLHNAAVAVFDGLGNPVCAPDFNGDGNLDPDDLADYIACYFSTPPCPQADINGDSNIDPDDLSDYIAQYFGGC